MGYNAKNYTEQGGEKTVIGGVLEIAEEGALVLEGNEVQVLASQEDSEASTVSALKDDFNALLAKLRDSGLMAEPPVE